LGAIGGMALACYTTQIQLASYFYLVLGLCVWIIYLTDHLWDSFQSTNNFEGKYDVFRTYHLYFFFLNGILLIITIPLILFFLPKGIIYQGFGLGCALGFYFLIQHQLKGRFRRYFPKEILISCIYVIGVWFIPLTLSPKFNLNTALIMTSHFFAVLTNVFLFSYYEKDQDLNSSIYSFYTVLRKTQHKMIIVITSCISITTSVIYIWHFHSFFTGIMMTVPAFYYLLLPKIVSAKNLNRFYAELIDGVFLVFLFFLFFNQHC
jgi:hypothetical protein